MAHTFKYKLRTLQNILNTQVKYLKTCKKIKCISSDGFIIIEKFSVNGENKNSWIKAPKKDINSIIVRERSKLTIYNKSEPKGLNEAINETDIMDLRDNLKEIVE